MGSRQAIAEEAARVICTEQLTDFHAAKLKAVEHLGFPPRTPLPENAAVLQAVIEYQRLFGGAAYRERLRSMRAAALQAMRLLMPFSPRLVGGAVTGAVTQAHHVQLHVFADSAESVDIDLLNRGIDFEQDERHFRYANGRELRIPLVRLTLGGELIDVAIFDVEGLHRPPINPLEGRSYQRLDLEQAQALVEGRGGAAQND
ncbi:hypothetical protein [Sinimarinibacterium sp. CAU 1509]|uniref:hypothetical protein n=1 Tax=Sinimarinibacterium sp. CAU 1509 TaxID=2562283 RepID=UPI002009E300|nr:hypothetical protein [Sinimarinibacterium sp. CAU 1509]